jgi:hypothetical protein
MLERGTKVMSAIHKRLHFAQKKEFRLLAGVFSRSLPSAYPYAVEGAPSEIKQSDFDDRVDIIPVSDPNIFSMAQRVMLAQQELQMAQAAPEIHNLREAYKRMYEALEVKNIELLLPPQADVPPRDPISEHQAAIMGQPIKAFEFQNHDAYITAHVAFLQNPMMQQNQVALQAIQANIQEHTAMVYKQQIEQTLGQQLPPLDQMQNMPEEQQKQIMDELSLAAANAAQEVTGQQQALLEAQQNTQIDPVVELKREEIAQRAQSDALRSQVDIAKIESQEAIAEMKVAQDREEALLKAENDNNKTYGQILKDVRSADTNTKGT